MPRTLFDKLGWLLAAAVSALVLGAITGVVHGGPLDPTAPPAPTMHTLNQVPPSWDQQLDATNGGGSGCGSTRFECVMINTVCNPLCHFVYEGVLDHETGLVWERNPALQQANQWHLALEDCLRSTLGSRSGWRAATAAELMSLLDASLVNPAVSLPLGNPFLNVVTAGTIWTATEVPLFTTNAYVVSFRGLFPGLPGLMASALKTGPTTTGAWCVRGANTQ